MFRSNKYKYKVTMDTDSNSKTVMKNKKMRNSTQRMSFLYKKMFKEGFFAHTQSCHEKKQKQKKTVTYTSF